jgi:hypothetical protein
LQFLGAVMKNLELASPSEMSASARAGEITAILAAAIVRTAVAERQNREKLALASCPTSAFIQPLSTGEVVMNEKQASVAARIAELSSLPIAELWPVWDRYFPAARSSPRASSSRASPTSCRRRPSAACATRASAWKPSAQAPKIKLRASCRVSLRAGHLLREWGEREHKVTVTAEGLFE